MLFADEGVLLYCCCIFKQLLSFPSCLKWSALGFKSCNPCSCCIPPAYLPPLSALPFQFTPKNDTKKLHTSLLLIWLRSRPDFYDPDNSSLVFCHFSVLRHRSKPVTSANMKQKLCYSTLSFTSPLLFSPPIIACHFEFIFSVQLTCFSLGYCLSSSFTVWQWQQLHDLGCCRRSESQGMQMLSCFSRHAGVHTELLGDPGQYLNNKITEAAWCRTA